MSPERSENKVQNRIDFEELTRFTKEVVLKDGGHIPMVIVEGSRQTIVGYIPPVLETHEERMQFMNTAGSYLANNREIGILQQVFFIGEGWVSLGRDGKPPKVSPSQDPNRKEVLIISSVEIENDRKNLKLFEMIRNQNGELVELQELQPDEGDRDIVEIPLLDAFIEGFELEVFKKLNRLLGIEINPSNYPYWKSKSNKLL